MTDSDTVSCLIDRAAAIAAMKMECWRVGEKQLADRLEASLLDLPLVFPAFKVKPLVWEDRHLSNPQFIAMALGLTYVIGWYPDVGWSWVEEQQGDYYEAASEEDAKAQAQYNFEHRILAMLEPA